MAGIGREYTFQDVTIRLDGRTITGAQGISYTSSQESPNVHGAGREPRAYSRKKREYEGELTLLGSQLNTLIQEIGAGRSRSLLGARPVDIAVTYSSDDTGDIWTDVLRDVRFTEIPKELSLDDDFMEVVIPLSIGRIDYATVTS